MGMHDNRAGLTGRLLRDADAQPDLLGSLIQATKDGDQSKFQALAGSGKLVEEGPEEDLHESEFESEPEQELEVLTVYRMQVKHCYHLY